MGTETFSFWLLGPEKNAFKDGNPTFKIMTKWSIFWSKFIGCFDWGFHFNISLFLFVCNFCSFTWHLLFRIFICTGWSISQRSKHLMKFFLKYTPFCHDFKSRVTIFKCIFLRPKESKWQSFSAHQKENYMQIPKLT